MLKETTGAFDGARTHDLHITSQMCNPLRRSTFTLTNSFSLYRLIEHFETWRECVAVVMWWLFSLTLYYVYRECRGSGSTTQPNGRAQSEGHKCTEEHHEVEVHVTGQ